jgi:transposase
VDLTDRQWTIIEPLFEEQRRQDGRGRPWRDARAMLNEVLWVLRTGAPWHDLPDRYPPYQTCHQRFQQWRKNGVFRDLCRGRRDRSQCRPHRRRVVTPYLLGVRPETRRQCGR